MRSGEKVVGKVVRVSPAGLFLTLPDGAVALLDRTDIPDVDGATGEGNPRVDDVLAVVILTVPELGGEVCRVIPTEPWTSGVQEADDVAVTNDGASTIGALPGLIAAPGVSPVSAKPPSSLGGGSAAAPVASPSLVGASISRRGRVVRVSFTVKAATSTRHSVVLREVGRARTMSRSGVSHTPGTTVTTSYTVPST